MLSGQIRKAPDVRTCNDRMGPGSNMDKNPTKAGILAQTDA